MFSYIPSYFATCKALKADLQTYKSLSSMFLFAWHSFLFLVSSFQELCVTMLYSPALAQSCGLLPSCPAAALAGKLSVSAPPPRLVPIRSHWIFSQKIYQHFPNFLPPSSSSYLYAVLNVDGRQVWPVVNVICSSKIGADTSRTSPASPSGHQV